MRNIFKELVEKEKYIVEIHHELAEKEELLNFSLDEQTRIEKEKKSQKEDFVNKIKKVEKSLSENNYGKPDIQLRKVKELVREIRKELTQ